MNIRSIPNNLQILNDLLLCDMDKKFDVLGLSETRLDKNIESLYNIPGYNLYTKNRDRQGGGVCMYVSNAYNSCFVPECSVMEPQFESVCVELFEGNNKLYLASIY